MSLETYGPGQALAGIIIFGGGAALMLTGAMVSGARSMVEYPATVADQVARDGFTNYSPTGNPVYGYLDGAQFGDCSINFKSINVVDSEDYLFKAKNFANFFAGRSALDVNDYAVVILGQPTEMTHTVQNAAELEQYVQDNKITSLASCIPKKITLPTPAG